MSIWCSHAPIGHDDLSGGAPDVGTVVSYPHGWSNHYPNPVDGPERPASLDTAHIPVWCVPGHGDDGSFGIVGPWLRLSVNSWAHDFASGGEKITGPESANVCMDETAVRALVADLTDWLEQPKAHPDVPLRREANQ